MSNVYRIMTTLALAQAAIAAEWTSTTSDSKQCAAWQIATTERFECDMNWNCKAKDAFKEMLGNDAEVIANQEKNVSKGGDDWKWKCDPTFLVLQKHAVLAAEWTSTTSDSKQCAAWQIATTERFECDMNWNCKAKDSFKEMLGNDAEVIANQEKNASAGGDDWKWKCDPTFLVMIQKHALQGEVAAEDVAAAEDAASWDEE